MEPTDPRERVIAAALSCVQRVGFTKTSIEDVARAAGYSRATVYRYFPGGRDEVFEAAVGMAMATFFADLAAVGVDAPDLRTRLALVLPYARHAVLTHPVLQRVLALEPELILPMLTTESNRLLPLIAEFLMPLLTAEVAAGRLPADDNLGLRSAFLARMLLSLMSSPAGSDLGDPAEVLALIDQELLVGFVTH